MRHHGKIAFFDLRSVDRPWPPLQCVVKRNEVSEEVWKLVSDLRQEAAVIVRGVLVESERAPGGVELHVRWLKVVHNPDQPFPLGKKSHSPDVLMRLRHLAVRGQRYVRIWLVRERLLHYLREWFERNGWHEVSPPIFVQSACEGGATLFEVKWFWPDVKVYLTQSAQLYLEAMCFALGKVWCLAPSFRAEKSRTRRHLAEYWHLEAEAAFMGFEELLRTEEELISYTIKKLLDDPVAGEIIKEFRGDDLDDLESVKPPFPRVTYDEAIEILRRKGFNIKWGDDIGADEEAALVEEVGRVFFLTHFPVELKSFYVKADPKRPEVALAVDCIAPEVGEITGGSERETEVEVLVQRIKSQGFDPRNYEWYLDLRRYGSVQHSGFGLGVDRMLMWVLKLEHIRDALPFPRLARVKLFI